MKKSLTGVALATMVIAMAACSDSTMPTKPSVAAASLRADTRSGEHTATVHMLDACDPTTFNTPPGPGPGTCVRNGGITFETFISQLTRSQTAPAWHFAPSNVNMRVGDILTAVNMGGEVHTFTEVEEFGGGIIPPLNALSGNTKVADECKALAPSAFVAPGASVSEEEEEAGDEKYQCCIHPWMRAIVHISAK